MTTYRDAGVDVERGYEAVRRMRAHVARTRDANVLDDLGGFGGLYSIAGHGMESPVLVAGADGVGTKLKLAFLLDKHDTVGIDCVAMCVNDVVCQGARPLFFLDYLATGCLQPAQAEAVVAGVAEGCVQAGCALIGGETAEMPGFYPDGEYDLAGFAVGMVDKDKRVRPEHVRPGDALIGLASSGLHANGFSLVRKLLVTDGVDLAAPVAELGCALGEELLRPTRIYAKAVLALLAALPVHGIAHITGGGFIENIPRMLPDGLAACIRRGAWPVPAVFGLLRRAGELADAALYNTFNMGIGLVLAVPQDCAAQAVRLAVELGERAYIIGDVQARSGEGLVLA
ncbi:MAG: phosphoribosylformylglycinamidine cyclo-ligase [Oscillospiraceae bacterium]|jgi:phosphoribosylformylglycinamidine cyclo-ligase|nr:phosphoribosylformylglycinamidine cyclo-ligase [Oscillospiraceae bacterium]